MPKFVDTTGNKFGHWTVIKELHGGLIVVKCCCGLERTIKKYMVVGGKSKSCGCRSYENVREKMIAKMINKRFGKLIVIGFDKVVNKTMYYWKCLCDCGVVKSISCHALRGGVISCGCHNKKSPFNREPGSVSFNCLFYNYKRNAQKRDIAFELTVEQVKSITKLNCFYCGKPPSQVISKGHSKSRAVIEHYNYMYNGVDRVNPDLPYVLSNVVPCCWACNAAKNDMPVHEFKDKIIAIHSHKSEQHTEFYKNYFESIPAGIAGKRCGVATMACYYRRNARYRNVPFELTLHQFYMLTKGRCFYCGEYPKDLIRKYVHNGIDRIDNNMGYTVGNVVTCCKRCNIAKGTMLLDDFYKYVDAVYNNWANKLELPKINL